MYACMHCTLSYTHTHTHTHTTIPTIEEQARRFRCEEGTLVIGAPWYTQCGGSAARDGDAHGPGRRGDVDEPSNGGHGEGGMGEPPQLGFHGEGGIPWGGLVDAHESHSDADDGGGAPLVGVRPVVPRLTLWE